MDFRCGAVIEPTVAASISPVLIHIDLILDLASTVMLHYAKSIGSSLTAGTYVYSAALRAQCWNQFQADPKK